MAPTKKQRLEAHDLLGTCSTANLERIINRLVPNHEMHAESRRHIDRCLLEELDGLTESVILATTDEDWEWTFLNPSRLIEHFVGSRPDLGAVTAAPRICISQRLSAHGVCSSVMMSLHQDISLSVIARRK